MNFLISRFTPEKRFRKCWRPIPYPKRSQKELADRTGITKKTVQEIVQGRSSLSAHRAVALEKVLGIKATFWLNLQAGYEADLTRIEARDGSEMNSPSETILLCNDGETGNVESGCP